MADDHKNNTHVSAQFAVGKHLVTGLKYIAVATPFVAMSAMVLALWGIGGQAKYEAVLGESGRNFPSAGQAAKLEVISNPKIECPAPRDIIKNIPEADQMPSVPQKDFPVYVPAQRRFTI